MTEPRAPHESNHESNTRLHDALSLAEQVALEAGALLRERCYQGPVRLIEEARDEVKGEVHALADLQAERLIRAKLCALEPQWGFRAEEEPELNRAPQDPQQTFWLVDPNDGTSAFLKGERGASVSIALIREGAPVLGVIYAYMGLDDEGDLFTWAEGSGPVQRQRAPLKHSEEGLWRERWGEAVIFVSNSADRVASAYQESLEGASFRVAPGVAYRLALVAAGEGEAATSLAGPRDFDYAAGHALLIGSGGALVDERGREVRYHPTNPQRLGFAFGGHRPHLQQLTRCAWAPVLNQQGALKSTAPLLPPAREQLCSDTLRLRRALCAWWGYHLGAALHDQPEHLRELEQRGRQSSPQRLAEMELSVRARGVDAALTQSAREALAHPSSPLPPLMHTLFGLIEGEEITASSLERTSPAWRLAARGLELLSAHPHHSPHRSPWPERLIGALLSARQGPLSRWGSDSARLIEALTTLTHPLSSLTTKTDR